MNDRRKDTINHQTTDRALVFPLRNPLEATLEIEDGMDFEDETDVLLSKFAA